MSRITVHTKCRLCRAEGQKLYLKGIRCTSAKCPIEKRGAVRPGMHGAKNTRKPTDYGIQLRAKQKAKRLYGIAETQFRNYYLKAKTLKGLLGENLMSLVERRLDNVIYISGFTTSRSAAKQLISHKHVYINGKINNICSYSTKIGDIITAKVKDHSELPVSEKDFKAPHWLQIDNKNLATKVISLPTAEEINTGIDVNLIVEYYSR